MERRGGGRKGRGCEENLEGEEGRWEEGRKRGRWRRGVGEEGRGLTDLGLRERNEFSEEVKGGGEEGRRRRREDERLRRGEE